MLRTAVTSLLCPLVVRSCTRVIARRPPRLPRTPSLHTPPLYACRCLTTTGPRRQNSQPVNDSTQVTDVKQHLAKLSEDEKNEFARSALSALTPEEAKRLRVLEMEYDVWMSTGVRVPETMTPAMWLQLIHTPTRHGRSKLYRFWFKRQMKELREVEKREARQEAHVARQEEKRRELEEKGRQQGLPEGEIPIKYTISLFVRPKTMLQTYYHNLAWSMQHGQPLVLDLSLEAQMRDRELTSVVKQILDAYAVNKVEREPFDWVMTGVKSDGVINSKLSKSLDLDKVPVTLTPDDYLSRYPADRLVYLTPNSPHELVSWDPEAVYVVGALVDLTDEKPVTFAKARRQQIKTARLPLDRYLMWEMGSKALTLDVMVKILCEMKNSGDWVRALKHVPKRKATLRPQYLKKGARNT